MHRHHLLLLSHLFTTVLSGCPQSCNARGNCNTNNQCECFNGFRGAACGEFTCPIGVPWFEAAEIIDVSHRSLTATECSTMGTCNRLNGKCGCYDGFEGLACETMMCPNNCNSRGRCISITDAATSDDDLDLHVTTTYNLWDGNRIYGCLCDASFTGYDCSLRTCIQGQDPRKSYTTTMVDETQTYACTATSGTFKFNFRGQATSAIAYSSTASTLITVLKALSTIDDVAVTVSNSAGPICDANGACFFLNDLFFVLTTIKYLLLLNLLILHIFHYISLSLFYETRCSQMIVFAVLTTIKYLLLLNLTYIYSLVHATCNNSFFFYYQKVRTL